MERIGRYEIQALIGRGGFGRVYRAWDPVAGRVVAVKVLLTAGGGAMDDDLLARFRREAAVLGALRHANVVTFFDYGEHQATPYLAMEFLSGRDLQKHAAAGEMTLLDRVSVMEQVAAGLQHAHRHGIVHRDVKPANIMVLDSGAVKIMDFGIARLASEEATQLTMAGNAIGTVAYMAPEQLRGETVDHRADIFAFGVVLYELVAGAHPFRTSAPDTLASRILNDEPPPVDGVPAALGRLIARALEKDPGSRYQSMEDLLCDLVPVRLELAARHAGTAARPEEGAAAVAGLPRRRWWWSAAAGTLAVLAVAVYFAAHPPRPTRQGPSLAPRTESIAPAPAQVQVDTDIASGWVALDGVAKGSLRGGAFLLVLNEAGRGEHLIEIASDEGGRAQVHFHLEPGGAIEFGRVKSTPDLETRLSGEAAHRRVTVRMAMPPRPAAPATTVAPPVPSETKLVPPPPPVQPARHPAPGQGAASAPALVIAAPPDALDAEIRRQQQQSLDQAAFAQARAASDLMRDVAVKPAALPAPDLPAILQTLQALRAAYANKDTAAIARLYPSVPKHLLNSLRRDIETLDVQFDVEGSPQSSGDVAVVTAQRTVATWFKGNRTPHAASDRVTITLRRFAGGTWVVENMR